MINYNNVSLVGYSGFVGSNLATEYEFNNLYNSKNIHEAFDTIPDVLVYSGVRAEKFIANKNPEADREHILEAIENIKKIRPKKLVLISTIDVYGNAIKVNEDTDVSCDVVEAYGLNRRYLESWVRENVKDYLIVRLPGLYGNNLKKNFIYDMINVIPAMLTKAKLDEFSKCNDKIKTQYVLQSNGFYKYTEGTIEDKEELKRYFKSIGFSAINFTDSRGIFQFYNLKYLWDHIEIAMSKGIKVLNLASEPICASELYEYVFGHEFINEITTNPVSYDFRTIHHKDFHGVGGYIFTKEFMLKDIKEFIDKGIR
ncbi:MAG: NAD-dependent epimerase/dehydratase family protein [Clostridium sp.]|uniref:NAD-dependent epimerase/dehydratase family protein n=1 Tax=Clostridium sp. TaxID=1506 RepID=UPI0032177769